MAGKPFKSTEPSGSHRTNLLLQTTMENIIYTLEFFHGQEFTWKPAGGHTFTDLDQAKTYMKAQAEMTNHMVDFRLVAR